MAKKKKDEKHQGLIDKLINGDQAEDESSDKSEKVSADAGASSDSKHLENHPKFHKFQKGK